MNISINSEYTIYRNLYEDMGTNPVCKFTWKHVFRLIAECENRARGNDNELRENSDAVTIMSDSTTTEAVMGYFWEQTTSAKNKQ